MNRIMRETSIQQQQSSQDPGPNFRRLRSPLKEGTSRVAPSMNSSATGTLSTSFLTPQVQNALLHSTQTYTTTILIFQFHILIMPPTSQLDPLGQLFGGQFIHAWSLFRELKYDEVKHFEHQTPMRLLTDYPRPTISPFSSLLSPVWAISTEPVSTSSLRTALTTTSSMQMKLSASTKHCTPNWTRTKKNHLQPKSRARRDSSTTQKLSRPRLLLTRRLLPSLSSRAKKK